MTYPKPEYLSNDKDEAQFLIWRMRHLRWQLGQDEAWQVTANRFAIEGCYPRPETERETEIATSVLKRFSSPGRSGGIH